jgi:hypothetical protein
LTSLDIQVNIFITWMSSGAGLIALGLALSPVANSQYGVTGADAPIVG